MTAARDAAIMEMKTTNGNLTTQLRQKDNQIRALQADMRNIKVAEAARTTEDVGTSTKGGKPNTCTRKSYKKWTTNMTEKNITTATTSGHTDTTPVNPISRQHAHGKCFDTKRKQHVATQWGNIRRTRRMCVRTYEK